MFFAIANITKMCYSNFTGFEFPESGKISFMRKLVKAALVLTVLLTLASCDREVLNEPDPITVVVTVEYSTGKIIQFIYHGRLVWQSNPSKSMSYHRNDDRTYIDYTDLVDQTHSLEFQGGELIRQQ